jgi:hypothetical protein
MREFVFVDDDWPGPGDEALTVLVPDAASKPEMLSWYGSNLGLPGHFTHNWDAFEQGLRDLSWIGHGHIWLRHAGLPLDNVPADLTTYLAILIDTVRYWNAHGSRRLSVSFPARLRPAVTSAAPPGLR